MIDPSSGTPAEIKDALTALLREIRHERERWDEGLATIRGWLDGPRRDEVVELVSMAARQERLEFQWKLTELVEAVLPPPPAKPDPKPEPEPAPPPPEPAPEPAPEAAAGAIRPEDLDLIAQDPRGFALAEHRPTGDWYFVTGQDPRGGLQVRKLSLDEKRTLQAQLGVL